MFACSASALNTTVAHQVQSSIIIRNNHLYILGSWPNSNSFPSRSCNVDDDDAIMGKLRIPSRLWSYQSLWIEWVCSSIDGSSLSVSHQSEGGCPPERLKMERCYHQTFPIVCGPPSRSVNIGNKLKYHLVAITNNCY